MNEHPMDIKKIGWLVVLICFLISFLFICLIFSWGCKRNKKKGYVAYVNGEGISSEDFLEFYSTRPRVAEWSSDEGHLDPNEVLNGLIDKILMVQKARNMGLDKLPGFKAQVEYFRSKEIVNQFLTKWFEDKIAISDEEARKRIPDYKQKEIKFARICVLTEDEAWAIKKKLEAGEDFSQLARERSIGIEAQNGGVGEFLSPHRGIYHKDVIETIFNLPLGVISDPQKIREGYALFKPLEVRPLNSDEMEQTLHYNKSILLRGEKNRLINQFLKREKEKRKIIIDYDKIKMISAMKQDALGQVDFIIAKGKSFELYWKDLWENLTYEGQRDKIPWKDPNILTRVVTLQVDRKIFIEKAKREGFESSPEIKKETGRFIQDLLVRSLMIKEIESTLVVSEEECRKYYQDNLTYYFEPEMVRISHILTKTKDKIARILFKLRHGEEFSALAQEYSEYKGSAKRGGDMGFLRHGESGMGENFEHLAFLLKKGEISDCIETPIGYQILKVTDKREARVIPFLEIKDKIRQELLNKKRQTRFEQLLEKLRQGAEVTINERIVQQTIESLLNKG